MHLVKEVEHRRIGLLRSIRGSSKSQYEWKGEVAEIGANSWLAAIIADTKILPHKSKWHRYPYVAVKPESVPRG